MIGGRRNKKKNSSWKLNHCLQEPPTNSQKSAKTNKQTNKTGTFCFLHQNPHYWLTTHTSTFSSLYNTSNPQYHESETQNS
jgi:hypothetical protein